MPRLTAKDRVTIVLLWALAALAGVLALLGSPAGAVVALAALVALAGTISRVEFAARRQDMRSQQVAARDSRRLLEQVGRDAAAASKAGARAESDLAALRSEIRGLRVGLQLLSQTTAEMKSEVFTSAKMTSRLSTEVVDESTAEGLQVGAADAIR